MFKIPAQSLTVAEFLVLPQGDEHCELVDGRAVPRVAPKFSHTRVQVALVVLLEAWGSERGWVGTEWAVPLTRRGRDWVPLPDLTFISFDRLPEAPPENSPCPAPPELAVEIISPDQTFGELAAKAADYLAAGVDRVWIVDPRARSLTVFFPDRVPVTLTGDDLLEDPLFIGLAFTPTVLFRRARLGER